MKKLLVGILLTASMPISADLAPTGTIKCTAKGLISGRWNVSLNAGTRDLEIKWASGSIYRGTANYLYSTARNDHTYFLGLDFASGVSVTIDTHNGREVAMCLKVNECYLCKE